MRLALIAALALASLLPPGGSASVSVSDAPALSFDHGHATVLALDGFGVLALTTAPLVDGAWAIAEDSAFVYVEVRIGSTLAEGPVALGEGAHLTIQRWEAGGEADADAPVYTDPVGTLTLTTVHADHVEGTLEAGLTRLDVATGEETPATVRATFRAIPGPIPAP